MAAALAHHQVLLEAAFLQRDAVTGDTGAEPVNNAAGFDGTLHDARRRMCLARYRASIP